MYIDTYIIMIIYIVTLYFTHQKFIFKEGGEKNGRRQCDPCGIISNFCSALVLGFFFRDRHYVCITELRSPICFVCVSVFPCGNPPRCFLQRKRGDTRGV